MPQRKTKATDDRRYNWPNSPSEPEQNAKSFHIKRDYVLLHEATHIVDGCLNLTPSTPSVPAKGAATPATAFTRGIWDERTVPAPPYRDPLLERIRFRRGGAVLPINLAVSVYRSLQKTPFVSLYGSAAWTEDLAEYVAVYQWTMVLGQPIRIVLRDSGKEIFAYEPMKSALVRGRIAQMGQFYAPAP